MATRQSLASSRPLEQPGFLPAEPSGGFELPPAVKPPPAAPKASEAAPTIEVRGFAFEGNKFVSTATLEGLAAPYASRKVSIGELEELRQALSRYFVDRGYINSGALLPPDFYNNHQNSTVLEEPLDALDLSSYFNAYELGVTQTLVDTLRRSFNVGLLYTYRENSTTLLGQPFSFVPGEPTGTSKVNALRFGQEYLERWQTQALALRSTFSWGNTNTQPDSVPPGVMSLVPAKNYFFWLGQAQFTRLISKNGASLSLRGTVQWTNDRLVPIEQIAVGGVYSVRGYPENFLVRDQGYYGSIELRYPLFERPAGRQRLFIIPFFDFGAAWNTGAQRQDLSAVGVGLNWQFYGFTAELYYAYRLTDQETLTKNSLQNDGISFQLRYQF